MRWIHLLGFVLLSVAAALATSARADEALDVVLRAVVAEEQAPAKRAELIFRRGDAETRYLIERVLPDRLHMVLRSERLEQEIYVIGDRMYRRVAAGWTETAAPPPPPAPFSVAALFESRLEDVEELAPIFRDGVEQRVFMGTISWFAGRSRNEGELRIAVETASGLPRLLSFEGTCGASACAFEYALVYDPSIAIEAPAP